MKPKIAELTFLFLFLVFLPSHAQDSTLRWSPERGWDWHNKKQWACGFNYIPANAVNYTALWDKTSFSPEVIDKELSLVDTIGFNCLRVVIQFAVWEDDSAYFNNTFDKFLAICSKHKMKVVPAFFDDCTFDDLKYVKTGKQPDPVPGWYAYGWSPSPGHEKVDDPQMIPVFEQYITSIMKRFKTDERILFWDLYNEPTNRENGNNSLSLVRKVFEWVRQVDPSQPVTIGFWNDNKELNDIIFHNSDIITFHSYADSSGVSALIKHLKQYERPLICTEWLNRPLGSTVETILPVFEREKVGCLSWGLVNGKTQTHLNWGHRPGQPEPAIWQDDLFKNDHTPYRVEELVLFKNAINKMQDGELQSSYYGNMSKQAYERNSNHLDIFWNNEIVGKVPDLDDSRLKVTDEIKQLDSTLFLIERRVTAKEDIDSVRITLDFVYAGKSTYSVIPSVNYNGNGWGKGKEPKGFKIDEKWWTVSYLRTPIPGITYSEGEKYVFAMWSHEPQLGEVPFSCSIMPEEERTTHRLIWPEEEIPLVYSGRDIYNNGYRTKLSMKKGESRSFQAYLSITLKKPFHASQDSYLDIAWEMADKKLVSTLMPQQTWDYGIRFAKESLWAEEGNFKGFSIGLLPDAKKSWQQRESGRYEIGWCGQNDSIANSLMTDYLWNGNEESLEKAIECLDSWSVSAPLPNGLFVCHFDDILNKVKSPIDACNLGTAAINFFEAKTLAEKCGIARPNYEQIALNIWDFVMNNQDSSGLFAKSWNHEGIAEQRDGTIGCFLVPTMIEAYRISKNEAYLNSAKKAYCAYMSELKRNGYTTAGALDTWCIDRESSMPLLRSALMLYKVTGEKSYLADAITVSYYLSTWLWHYSPHYSDENDFSRYGYDPFGATSVSTQHNHLDVYATYWIPDWIELSKITGKKMWKEKALAIWRNVNQLISDGNLVIHGRLRPVGAQNEAYFQSSWNFYGRKDMERIYDWLVAWPSAFRLETLRKITDWNEFMDDKQE